ncbi:hypothetical protein MILUP08_43126 [Micromonospora lupini str. Lupac 08]|uniref:Uncharacterized protein n=1 Tax=Micromonospora lupini str. Lupac 08 TaxID=1150864 RepID=I0L324_9ACTN|nr:hypothetical protein MILUP08_43126 [Micromonospora lupini str. Lupac 08]
MRRAGMLNRRWSGRLQNFGSTTHHISHLELELVL